MNFFSLIHLLGLTIAISVLSACSNSEYVDEFGMPVSTYTPDEESLGASSLPDTLYEFPASGFFRTPFTIMLSESMNCETGGFIPTKNSPAIRTFHIDSSTTIRCAIFANDSSLASETIRTYLFEKKPTIPTIFITTDPNSLFDPDTGIYMEGPNAEEKPPHKGANYWLDKEIPIFVELIEEHASNPAFSEYAGLEIFGSYSRMHEKKSVAITFRKKYGQNKLYYRLFPKFSNLNSFKSIILRNFGNNFGNDYIRDRLAGSISNGLNVDYQHGRFVIVYYNGVYFGIHDMRERANEYYFETHYGISHKKIDLLKANNSISAGSADDYISLINWLETNNLDDDKNYTYLASLIDIDNFINYMQIELFINNRDWPGNNLKKWRQSDPKSPWRWFIYDCDQAFGSSGGAATNNVFEYATSKNGTNWANAPKHTFLFRSLLKNKIFRNAFINRMTTLLQMNFEKTRIIAQIDSMMSNIKYEIPRDQKKWSLRASHMDNQLEEIKDFVKHRQAIILSQLQDYFELDESCPTKLSINGSGSIQIHNLPLDKPSLTINFFKNNPVTITAKTLNGSTWLHWSDGDTNETKKISPCTDSEITAFFK